MDSSSSIRRVLARGSGKVVAGVLCVGSILLCASGSAMAGGAPSVTAPSVPTPSVATPSMPTIPSSATAIPTLPALGGSTGSGAASSQFQQQWQAAEQAQAQAEQSASTPPTTSNVPDPCGEVMMQAMASGKVSAGVPGCTGAQAAACSAAGLALNPQLQGLSDPQANSVTAPATAGDMPPAAWAELPAWQQQIILAQNPLLRAAMKQSPTADSGTPLGQLDPSASSGSTSNCSQP